MSLHAMSLLLAIANPAAAASPVRDFPRLEGTVDEGPVRLVVLGDTGARPVPEDTCATGASSCRNTAASRAALLAAVAAENADAVTIMGDLVYGPKWFESVPKCRKPDDRKAAEWLDPVLGELGTAVGAPVYLALGNHDVGHKPRSPRRERCLLRYAASRPELHLPALQYTVDLGGLRLVLLNTNQPPSRWDTPAIQEAVHTAEGWVVMGGHHVIRTAFDKESEHEIRDHLRAEGITPDLWVNGHAHFLQFGVYDGIPAATSGSASKIRVRPSCPGDDCSGDDMPLWGQSTFGYAVVDATEDRLRLTFKDGTGAALWCWERTADDPSGQECSPEPPPG